MLTTVDHQQLLQGDNFKIEHLTLQCMCIAALPCVKPLQQQASHNKPRPGWHPPKTSNSLTDMMRSIHCDVLAQPTVYASVLMLALLTLLTSPSHWRTGTLCTSDEALSCKPMLCTAVHNATRPTSLSSGTAVDLNHIRLPM